MEYAVSISAPVLSIIGTWIFFNIYMRSLFKYSKRINAFFTCVNSFGTDVTKTRLINNRLNKDLRYARALERSIWTNAGPNSSQQPISSPEGERWKKKSKKWRGEGKADAEGKREVVSFYTKAGSRWRTSDRRRMFIFLFRSRSRILSRICVKAKMRFSVTREYKIIHNSIDWLSNRRI